MTSYHPKVSIIIPCFNAERTIHATLESVLRQTWPNLEVIVLDDGSTDASASVVKQIQSPLVQLERQPNRGQTAALNAALRLATGDYIQYLDADDLIAPEKIELQMKRLLCARNCIASSEWGRFYGKPDEASFEAESVWQDLDPLDWLAMSRADGLGMMFPALWLCPRSIVEKTGFWREDLSLNNDAEYFTRALLNADRVLFCAGARCYYRSGLSSSLSGRKSVDAWASQFKVIELCEQYIYSREYSERTRRAFSQSWQHLAHACYPYSPVLAEVALARGNALHDIRISPGGGTAFRLISRLLGWRFARRVQVLAGR
jgi:glycosyltransferase involved in cell wall biosynthesis